MSICKAEMKKKFTPTSLGESNPVYDSANNMNEVAPEKNSSQQKGLSKNGKSDKEKKDKKKEEQPQAPFFQLFRFAARLDFLFLFLGIVSSIANGCSMPIMMVIFGNMVDSFVASGRDSLVNPNNTVAVNDRLVREISDSSALYAYIGLGVFVVQFGQTFFMAMLANRQIFVIRRAFFRSILRQEIGWFDTHEIGELNTRLSEDVNKIGNGVGDKLGTFIQWMAVFVAGMIIGFVRGPKLTGVMIAVSPLLAASGGVMTFLLSSFTEKELKAYSKAGAIAEEVLGAIRTVVAFGGQYREHARYKANLTDAKGYGIRKGVIAGSSLGLVMFIVFCVYALVFWYGSQLIRSGEYTVGTMLIVFFSVLFATFSLGTAMTNLQAVAESRGAAFTVFQIIDNIPKIDSSSKEGLKPDKVIGNIEFRDVFFNYPSRPDTKILNGLSFRIDVGQTVALVGSSGCGKSTTAQLIQRFYDPLTGTVLLDGRDLRDYNIEWLRRRIGVVSQEPVLFGQTIIENIRYGQEGVTDAEVESAAKNANAHDFISRLPNGYETLVGERGAQLSGGQKQRIAIARALVRDPRILLLDEATSALDTESEATVQAALDRARQGRTTLVIAHRLSTIRTADRIVSVSEGTVAESGTHDELMAIEDGIYNQLVTNQAMMNEEDALSDEKGSLKHQLSQKSIVPGKFHRELSIKASAEDGTAKNKSDEEEGSVSMGRLFKMNAPEWPYILFGLIGALANGAVQPAFAIIFAEILGVYALPLDQQESQINFYSGMFVVIGVGNGIAQFVMSAAFAVSGECLTLRLRQLAFKTLLQQEIAYFDDHANNVGALCTRLATDASAVQGATGIRLGTVFMSLSSLGAGLIIGFVFSWKLALGILAFVPPVVVSGYIQMKLMSGNSQTDSKNLEGGGKISVECIENIRTVASLSKEESFYMLYSDLLSASNKQLNRKMVIVATVAGFTQAVIFFAYAGSFYFGAWLIQNDGLNFNDMFKVISAIIFSAMAVGQASSFAPDAGKAQQAAVRVFNLLDRKPAIDNYSEEGLKPENVEGNVAFKDVSFRYPTRPTVSVLKSLNIDISRGKTLALVGSSGCGKSTSVQLMERFYDTESGSVNVDGNNVKDINVQHLRSKIGLVQQEPILFDTSIAENIAYGDNNRTITMPEIIEAARKANIHSFIEQLPDGYDTNVGDKGAQLSGGQKQRVAIARALIRDPKILLLDEATSALDTESEKVVQEALDRAREGRTSIVIAHRLSTIRNADKIAVIEKGVVSEVGTHSELMANKRKYYKLNVAQGSQI